MQHYKMMCYYMQLYGVSGVKSLPVCKINIGGAVPPSGSQCEVRTMAQNERKTFVLAEVKHVQKCIYNMYRE